MTKKSNPEKGKNEIVNRYHPTNNFFIISNNRITLFVNFTPSSSAKQLSHFNFL